MPKSKIKATYRDGYYLREGIFIPEGPLVSVVRSKINGHCEIHAHNFEELVIIASGEGLHIIGGKTTAVGKGDILVITEGVEHEYLDAIDLELLNIEYDRRELLACAGDLKGSAGFHTLFSFEKTATPNPDFKLNDDDLLRTVNWINEIEYELENSLDGFQTICRADFLKLVTFLSRAYSKSNGRKVNYLNWRMGKILAYLENNFQQEITAESMAEKANLSLRQFFRTFNNVTGVPPLQYLLNIRIEKAKQMLLGTNLSINEISFRCGMNDSNYFARIFKQKNGQSPSQFRKSNNNHL